MFKRKAIRKIIFFMVVFSLGFSVFIWVYNNYLIKIPTVEIDGYYDLLSKHAKPGKDLMLNLGVRENDDLQIVIDRIKGVMGLGDYKIWIAHHDDPKEAPAHITHMGYGVMSISLYKGITQKREEINLLTHELGHIFVWNLDKSILEGADQEKVVDCSGVFLGLGVLLLNGLTDDFFFMPGEGYHSEKKFFGYLKPEQFGYLFARYCAEQGIEEDNIMPFLSPTGRKYFNIGRKYLERQDKNISRSSREVKGSYWCKKCGHFMRFSLSRKLKDIKCSKCSWVVPLIKI